MKTKFFAIAAIAVLLTNILGFASGDTRHSVAKRRQATRLVSLLPASDGVVVFESKRFLDNALPQLLSANQPVLGQVMAKISEMENHTGIDLRKFDQVVVGLTMKPTSAKKVDIDAVAIASGDISAGALVAVVKLASNGTYREEKIGEHTVYVFSAKAVMQKTAAKSSNSKIADAIDNALKGLTHEVAVTALDNNTLAIGSVERVRETLEGKTHVAPEISSLLFIKETAIGSFALRPPGGMSAFLPLDNDQLDRDLDSIQFLYGSADVATAGTSLQVAAKTKKTEQAKDLKDTLEGLQLLGKGVLGGSKRIDQQVYGRILKNAKIDARGNEVTLDLTIPQSDIDILVAGIK